MIWKGLSQAYFNNGQYTEALDAIDFFIRTLPCGAELMDEMIINLREKINKNLKINPKT